MLSTNERALALSDEQYEEELKNNVTFQVPLTCTVRACPDIDRRDSEGEKKKGALFDLLT
jgi:hypothetical protein